MSKAEVLKMIDVYKEQAAKARKLKLREAERAAVKQRRKLEESMEAGK